MVNKSAPRTAIRQVKRNVSNMARPRKWTDPEKLKEQISQYLEQCQEDEKMPTKAGLAIHLDTNHETLNSYRKKDGFSEAIKAADQHIEEAWNQKLAGHSSTGAIFYLKAAFQYRDRSEVDVTSGGHPIPLLSGQSNADKSNNINEETTEAE